MICVCVFGPGRVVCREFGTEVLVGDVVVKVSKSGRAGVVAQAQVRARHTSRLTAGNLRGRTGACHHRNQRPRQSSAPTVSPPNLENRRVATVQWTIARTSKEPGHQHFYDLSLGELRVSLAWLRRESNNEAPHDTGQPAGTTNFYSALSCLPPMPAPVLDNTGARSRAQQMVQDQA